MKNQVRFAVVGCGRIAQSHFQALSGVADVQLTAVVEPREAAGQAAAEENRCRWFQKYDDPRVAELADAVIICTPPSLHYPIASHFLEHGLHVLCEKPLSLTSTEAKGLVALGAEKQRVLMMASKFRYVGDVIKTKSIIEAGILGDIILYENTFCGRVLMRDRWNSERKIAGGGVLIDNGSHSVDIARYLLGPIREVQAVYGVAAQDLEVEDTARIQFRTEAGVNGMVDLSWSINKEMDHYISVFGSEGTLHVGWRESRYRQEGNSSWISYGAGYDKLAAFRSQIQNFIDTLRERTSPLITPEDALASVQVIESAYESANNSHWVAVEKTP